MKRRNASRKRTFKRSRKTTAKRGRKSTAKRGNTLNKRRYLGKRIRNIALRKGPRRRRLYAGGDPDMEDLPNLELPRGVRRSSRIKQTIHEKIYAYVAKANVAFQAKVNEARDKYGPSSYMYEKYLQRALNSVRATVANTIAGWLPLMPHAVQTVLVDEALRPITDFAVSAANAAAPYVVSASNAVGNALTHHVGEPPGPRRIMPARNREAEYYRAFQQRNRAIAKFPPYDEWLVLNPEYPHEEYKVS